jgi:hypothetical protein
LKLPQFLHTEDEVAGTDEAQTVRDPEIKANFSEDSQSNSSDVQDDDQLSRISEDESARSNSADQTTLYVVEAKGTPLNTPYRNGEFHRTVPGCSSTGNSTGRTTLLEMNEVQTVRDPEIRGNLSEIAISRNRHIWKIEEEIVDGDRIRIATAGGGGMVPGGLVGWQEGPGPMEWITVLEAQNLLGQRI